ncbi:MAG: CaiB/BaiF CoA transferase family protein, partial [Dehalococcoidia bacterium]
MLPGALAPYRVLDLTGDLGALCARMLADLGADVIKVEPPGGDSARLIGPFYGGDPDPERSLRWLFFNANKRGITLDLNRPEGPDLLRRLAGAADFVVESFAPGYMESLGLGYEALAALNPRLIGLSITPFGRTGPYSGFKSSDLVAWAMGGHMELVGDADRAPLRVSYPQSWSLAGAQAAAGAMMALAARRRTGLGQHVDVSAQESVTWTLMIAAQIWDITHVNPRRGGAVRTVTRPGGERLRTRVIWPCKDGFVYWALTGGSSAGAVASMRGLVDWMNEEGAADAAAEVQWQDFAPAGIDQQTYERLTEPFRLFFLRKTKRELFEAAAARSIQLAPTNTLADHDSSPQLAARHFFEAVEHPRL